jgi:uncharacterized membrane protein
MRVYKAMLKVRLILTAGLFAMVLLASISAVVLAETTALAQPVKPEMPDFNVSVSGRNPYLTAGRDGTIHITVSSTSNNTYTNIVFSANAQDGWVISFSPAAISSLGPRTAQNVDMIVRPPSGAGGGQDIEVTARSDQADAITFVYVNIQTAPIWTWVGIGIGIAAIITFVIIYLKMGRKKV